MEHTPKNLLIRAVRAQEARRQNTAQLEQFLSVETTLDRLLREDRLI